MGLVSTFFKIPRNLNNRFTCTQFIAYALNKSNVETVNKPVSLILPTDYYDIPNSRIIYKGKLKSYVNNNLYFCATIIRISNNGIGCVDRSIAYRRSL